MGQRVCTARSGEKAIAAVTASKSTLAFGSGIAVVTASKSLRGGRVGAAGEAPGLCPGAGGRQCPCPFLSAAGVRGDGDLGVSVSSSVLPAGTRVLISARPPFLWGGDPDQRPRLRVADAA